MSDLALVKLPKLPMNPKQKAAQKRKQLQVRRAGNRPIRIGRTLVGFGDYTEAKGRKAYDKKKAKKARRKANKQAISSSAASGDWWSTLSSIGNVVGPMLGKAALAAITGFGDYAVDTNTITAQATGGAIGGNIPIMQNSHCANIIRHREYIGVVNGNTGAFSGSEMDINPGLPTSFPWLAPIAACYTRYRWRGLVYEYVPLSSDYSATSQLGFVALGTQYNPLDAAWQDKRTMLNAEYSCEEKPSKVLVHPIECAKNQLSIDEYFVRSGPVPTGADQRFYDVGTLTYAVGGNNTSGQLGELWATYEIEFYQPKLSAASNTSTLLYQGTSISTSTGNWFGTQSFRKGNMTGASFNANTFFFPASVASGRYLVALNWTGASAVIATAPTYSLTNCAYGGDITTISAGQVGASANSFIQIFELIISSTGAAININNLSATFPQSTFMQFHVVLMEDANTPLLTHTESKAEVEADELEEDELDELRHDIDMLRQVVVKLMTSASSSPGPNVTVLPSGSINILPNMGAGM